MALINWFRFLRGNDADRGVLLFRRANAAFQKEMATAAYTAAVNRATAMIQRTEPHQ